LLPQAASPRRNAIDLLVIHETYRTRCDPIV